MFKEGYEQFNCSITCFQYISCCRKDMSNLNWQVMLYESLQDTVLKQLQSINI